MSTSLLNLPAKKLLLKFGAGEHKPGSGSAAALQGMLSAQLIITVINLTTDPKRRNRYKKTVIADLEVAESNIKNKLYPELERLFYEDSSLFDKAIKLRRSRDEETDKEKRKKLSNDAIKALIPATETPIEIALLCVELAKIAKLLFDSGFQSARGDSGVAMSGAVLAIAGCLSIVDLNLLSFTPNKWLNKIRDNVLDLRNDYDQLASAVQTRLDLIRDEVSRNIQYHQSLVLFQNKKVAKSITTNQDIEEMTIRLQKLIWVYRDKIWKSNIPTDPIEILDSKIVAKLIKYNFTNETTLGQQKQGGKFYEVAGLINNKTKSISISDQFPIEVQRFTGAHELGHALMHEQAVLHRDRALDGSKNQPTKDKIERQADKFATFFLMPKKLVVKKFTSMFLTEQFSINESTAFALISDSESVLKKECPNLRALSVKLASTESYNTEHYTSLAQQFRVSVETMAIRLEELDLAVHI